MPLYLVTSGKKYALKIRFFVIFVTNEAYKIFKTSKRNFLDTTISLDYLNKTFSLMNFIFFKFKFIKFYNFFIHFLCSFIFSKESFNLKFSFFFFFLHLNKISKVLFLLYLFLQNLLI